MKNVFLRFVVWSALAVVLMGSRCGEVEAVPLEVLRRDVAPAFDYGLYSDARGRLVGERSGVLLVHRGEHLERVYADAHAGDARAQTLVRQLEEATEAAGVGLADQALSLGCAALPTCTVRRAELAEVIPSRGPGGMRLRQSLARWFEAQARRERMEGAVITAALNVLLVGGVMMAVEAKAAAGEARAATAESKELVRESGVGVRRVLAEVEGRLAAEEAAALEARLMEAEALEVGPRQSGRLEVLVKQRPALHKPPPGVAADSPGWAEYVGYWERRYEELAGLRQRSAGLSAAKPPLEWPSYTVFQGRMRRALEFQREVGRSLHREVSLEEGARSLLRGMVKPRVDENLGLGHGRTASLTYVDQFVLDEATLRPGVQPTVHSFSNKQRDFNAMSEKQIKECLVMDVTEALAKYGGVVEIRRPGHPLFGREVTVSKVHLVYDGTQASSSIRDVLRRILENTNVELHFYFK